jgi:hypothetical protein
MLLERRAGFVQARLTLLPVSETVDPPRDDSSPDCVRFRNSYTLSPPVWDITSPTKSKRSDMTQISFAISG